MVTVDTWEDTAENLFTNPNLVGTGGTVNIYENLFTSSSFEAGSGIVEVQRNLAYDPGSASSSSFGGFAGTGNTGMGEIVPSAWSISGDAYRRTWTTRPNADGAVGYRIGSLGFTPDEMFTIVVRFQVSHPSRVSVGPGGAAGTGRVLGASSPAIDAVPGVTYTHWMTASWTTVGADTRISLTAGDSSRVDGYWIEVGDALAYPGEYDASRLHFVPGYPSPDPDLTPFWTGVANVSESVLWGVSAKSFTLLGNGKAYLSSGWSASGSTSLKMVGSPINNSSQRIVSDLFSVTPGELYTVMGTINMPDGISGIGGYPRSLQIRDSGGGILGDSGPVSTGGVTNVRYTFTPTAANIRFWLDMRSSSGTWFWDNLAVVKGDYTGPWFDGDHPHPDPDFTTAWTGEANGSTTLVTGEPVAGTTPIRGCVIIQSNAWAKAGNSSARIIRTDPVANSGAYMTTTTTTSDTLTGLITVWNGEGIAALDRAVTLQDYFNPFLSTPMLNADALPAMGESVDVRATRTTVGPKRIVVGAPKSVGESIWVDCAGLFAGTYTRPWFAGDKPSFSTRRYRWSGAPNASTSIESTRIRTEIPDVAPPVIPTARFRLENNGIVLDISNKMPKGFLRLAGARGFGIAPTILSIRKGAGEGGRWRQTKRDVRDMDIPIAFQADSEMEVLALMRKLVAVLDDTKTPAKLFVTYPDGTEVYTEVHYGGGGDHQYGKDTDGRTWARWPLTLRAPKPYWTDTEARNFSLRTAGIGRGLIKNTSLSKLQLTSSSAIGSIEVTNPGDVQAFPRWEVRGPGDEFSASIDGRGFVYEEPVLFSNPIIIDTEMKTVVDSEGVDRYDDLGAAPKLFAIPPGKSTIDIVMNGSDGTSLVQFNFQPRYEVVF